MIKFLAGVAAGWFGGAWIARHGFELTPEDVFSIGGKAPDAAIDMTETTKGTYEQVSTRNAPTGGIPPLIAMKIRELMAKGIQVGTQRTATAVVTWFEDRNGYRTPVVTKKKEGVFINRDVLEEALRRGSR